MSRSISKCSSEVLETAVKLVLEKEFQHGWRSQTIMWISAKIGYRDTHTAPSRPSPPTGNVAFHC
jgi:hypothetical protein